PRALVASHRCVAVQPDDEDVTTLPRLVQDVEMAVVQNIETAVDGDNPLSFASQRRRQLRQCGTRHKAEGIGVLKDFLGGYRRGAELADDDAGSSVRQLHGCGMIRTDSVGKRERRNDCVACAADIEYFAGARGYRKLLRPAAAEEGNAVGAKGENHVRVELCREQRADRLHIAFGWLCIWQSEQRA